MRDLPGFRATVRERRRAVGRTQQQLARAIGLHPNVLSHKLNGRDGAMLTAVDVTGIVTALAGWGALRTRADAYGLLDLLDLSPQVIPAARWDTPPLASLTTHAGSGSVPARRRPAGEPRLASARPPTPATPLVGRAAERELIYSALETARLVTLTGVGGTGKTRLAVQAAVDLADRYADGVVFVDLAPVSDPALLASSLLRALGMTPTSAAAAEGQLGEALSAREVLLVADNLEQLLDEAPLLARLLAAAPGLRILATSRIALRLYGEHVIRVPPLGLPAETDLPAGSEAVQLFVQRVRGVRPGYSPDTVELSAISAICTALDGLPLAIELAAAGTKLYSPQALLPLLQHRLDVLIGGPRDRPSRQQTLRAALDWSRQLLGPAIRQTFACLGVFAGSFDAAAAAAVCAGSPSDMLRQLEELADHSLLELAPGPTPRFRMLQTVREYALARLADTDQVDAVPRRHLAHYLSVATCPYEGDQAGWFDLLEADYPNLNAALDYAYAQAQQYHAVLREGLQLAAALGPLWQRRRSLADGALHLNRLLSSDAEQRTVPAATRVEALLQACALDCFRGAYRDVAKLAEEAIEISTHLNDHTGVARAHRYLGEAAIALGDDSAAERHFCRQLDQAYLAEDRVQQAAGYNMLGQVLRHSGQYDEATRVLWHALRLFGTTHDRDGVAAVVNSIGEVARDAGESEAAFRRFRAALHRHWELSNTRCIAYDIEGLAAVAAMRGDPQRALRYLGVAHTLREDCGAPLPPCEQAILERIVEPAAAALTLEERDQAYRHGRAHPPGHIVAEVDRPDRNPASLWTQAPAMTSPRRPRAAQAVGP